MSDSFKSYYRLGVVPAKPKIWVFWRFVGELWYAKFAKKSRFPRFCKNFQVTVRQKIFIMKVWFTIICTVCIVLFTETQNWVFIFNLFVISLGAKNGTNFKKSEILSWKSIFEALYLLNNALEYIYPTYIWNYWQK